MILFVVEVPDMIHAGGTKWKEAHIYEYTCNRYFLCMTVDLIEANHKFVTQFLILGSSQKKQNKTPHPKPDKLIKQTRAQARL